MSRVREVRCCPALLRCSSKVSSVEPVIGYACGAIRVAASQAFASVLLATPESTMVDGDVTRPTVYDPASPSTNRGSSLGAPSCYKAPSEAVLPAPTFPLTAAINPINRAFVPRLLPEHLDGHLRFPKSLASRRVADQDDGVAKALRAAILLKVEQFEVNHRRGAAHRGLPAQFTMSAKVLAGVVHGRSAKARVMASKDATPNLLPSSVGAPLLSAVAERGTLCFQCRKPSTTSPQRVLPATRIQVKPFTLPPLPRDWDEMLDAVQDSWEKGLNGSPALKTFVSGSTERAAMARNKQLLGRVSSSMLSKRGAIAKAAARSGGWSALRDKLRRERAARQLAGLAFPYNEVYKFCATLVSHTDL